MSEKEPICGPGDAPPPPYSNGQQQQQPYPQQYHQQYPQQYPQPYPHQQQPQQYQQPQQFVAPVPYPNQPPPGFVSNYGAANCGRPVLLQALAQTVTCHFCHQVVTTQRHYESGVLTWLLAGGICIFGGFIGCCLIPFCVDGCKDVVHRCPNCSQILGRFKRM